LRDYIVRNCIRNSPRRFNTLMERGEGERDDNAESKATVMKRGRRRKKVAREREIATM